MEIDPKLIKEGESTGISKKKIVMPDGMEAFVFYGRHALREDGTPRCYDSYTEALYANINVNRIKTQAAHGLDENAQTPEQAKAFKKRLEETKIRKEKAAQIVQGLQLVK